MKHKVLFVLLGLIAVIGPLVIGGWFILRASTGPLNDAELYAERRLKDTETDSFGEIQRSNSAFFSDIINVPFTPQAPLGDWKNVVFQQGCEEASVLMAMLWVEGKQMGSEEAAKAILAISRFEQASYGEFRDASARDTAKFMRDYFEYEKGEVKYNIGAEDIKRELGNGNLVIAPVNGQKMGNPFYTPPGPVQHMVVIRGYDAKTKEFITNDPGTKRGEGFRYPESVLTEALGDYETGYKEQILEIRKAMIIVRPKISP